MNKNSKAADSLRVASRKGYRVEHGQVISAQGVCRKLRVSSTKDGRPPYYVFNIKVGRVSYPIKVHQLVAFQKFGEELFEVECVRHLDGDSFNNFDENIALGSTHDNMMDIPEEERRDHSKRAGLKRLRTDWDNIDNDYFNNNLGYKKLGKKYGVAPSTLSCHFKQLRIQSEIHQSNLT